jgi:hypothetical protein
MAVRCSKCGEDLLGPVNRCWKCGQTFATLPETGGVPPVRREALPVAATPATAAPIVATTESGPSSAIAGGVEAPAPPRAGLISAASAAGQIRTGSPFGPGATMTPVAGRPSAATASVTRPKTPPTQALIRDHAAVAGAVGSLVLGVFGLGIAWMSSPTAVMGAALIAILGLIMGMWGLHSRRRGWALFGMLLCVAAISLASYSGAMLMYEAQLEAREMEGLLE